MRHLLFGALAGTIVLAGCGDDNDGTGPTPQCRVTAVSVSAPTTLEAGATAQATAELTTSNCTTDPSITWTSSDDEIATVSAGGVITGVAAGPVVITATAGGESGSAHVTVTHTPVADISLSTGQLLVGAGNSGRVVATPVDDEDNPLPGRVVNWSSSAPAVATVVNGVVTGVAPGDASITVESEGVSTSLPVKVVEPQLAFAWNHAPAAAPGAYPADPGYRYSTSGSGVVTFDRTATGRYSVSWPGFAFDGAATSATFISPYSASGTSCRPISWSPAAASLGCLGAAGDKNASFTTLTVASGTFGGRSAFAWVSDGAASGNSSSGWTYHPHGLPVYSERTGTGSYVVHFPGLGRTSAADREAAFVNAYGSATHCQTGPASTHGDSLRVPVYCFDPTGTPMDSRYTILVVDQSRPGAKLAFAVNEDPGNPSHQPANAAVRPTGSMSIQRTAPGSWTVDVTGFTRTGSLAETWMVVPNGSTPAYCTIIEWGSTDVGVSCQTVAGAPADVPFTVIGVQ